MDEIPLIKIKKLNDIAKSFSFREIPYQLCEICYAPMNLVICSICKCYYHPKCLGITNIPRLFTCLNCTKKFSKVKQSVTQNSIYDEIKQKKEPLIETPTSSSSKVLNHKRKREEKKKNEKHIQQKGKRDRDIIKKERENHILLSYEHSNPQYKRRKVKVGNNHNIDMISYVDKYENQINFDQEEYERNDLKQVWSSESNPFDDREIEEYIKTARLFWNYRNMFLENELCSDFFEECNKLIKEKKPSNKLMEKINRLMKELKGLVRRGVDLNCHYDEMALKMLHLCKYKKNVALLFLYKQLNPFIEEVEEGFKNDVLFFQNELISIINEGDYEIEE